MALVGTGANCTGIVKADAGWRGFAVACKREAKGVFLLGFAVGDRKHATIVAGAVKELVDPGLGYYDVYHLSWRS